MKYGVTISVRVSATSCILSSFASCVSVCINYFCYRYALIIAYIANIWGLFTIVTEMPTFIKEVLNFNIKSNGLISSLPYLCKLLLSYFMGFVADLIRRKGWMRILTMRKMFNTLGKYFVG